MHEAQIFHLDLKPKNMVIDYKGEVYITNFRCALKLNDRFVLPQDKSNGDTRYFSPERLAFLREYQQFLAL